MQDTVELPMTKQTLPRRPAAALWRESLCHEKTARSACVNFHSIADLVSPSKPYETERLADRAAEQRSPRSDGGSPPLEDDFIDVVDDIKEESHSPEVYPASPQGPDIKPDSMASDVLRASTPPSGASSTKTPRCEISARPSVDLRQQLIAPNSKSPSPKSPGSLSTHSDDISGSARETSNRTPPEIVDPSRGRKGRTIYKAQQVYVLEQVFSRTHYPDAEVIETLSKDLNITENKIKVWFQNKRARWRRRAAEVGHPAATLGLAPGQPGLPSWSTLNAMAGPQLVLPQPVYHGLPPSHMTALSHPAHTSSAFASPFHSAYSFAMGHHSAGPLKHPLPGYPLPVHMMHLWQPDPSKLNVT